MSTETQSHLSLYEALLQTERTKDEVQDHSNKDLESAIPAQFWFRAVCLAGCSESTALVVSSLELVDFLVARGTDASRDLG